MDDSCEQCENAYEKLSHDMQQHIEMLEQVIKDQDENIRMLLNQLRQRTIEDARKTD